MKMIVLMHRGSGVGPAAWLPPPLQWPSPAGTQEEISTQPRLPRVKGHRRAIDKVARASAADAQINVLHPKHAWPLTLWVKQL